MLTPKKTLMQLLATVTVALTLISCQGRDVSHYANLSPHLDLYSYFQGNTRGWGMVLDRQGGLSRQFTVDIMGSVTAEGSLVLKEDFLWNDGKKEKRTWTISRSGEALYTGLAGDVVGSATGKSSGNALNWRYTLAVDIDGSTWNVAFDDWMYQQPDNVLLNRAVMSKFGLRVGEVIIAFQKQ